MTEQDKKVHQDRKDRRRKKRRPQHDRTRQKSPSRQEGQKKTEQTTTTWQNKTKKSIKTGRTEEERKDVHSMTEQDKKVHQDRKDRRRLNRQPQHDRRKTAKPTLSGRRQRRTRRRWKDCKRVCHSPGKSSWWGSWPQTISWALCQIVNKTYAWTCVCTYMQKRHICSRRHRCQYKQTHTLENLWRWGFWTKTTGCKTKHTGKCSQRMHCYRVRALFLETQPQIHNQSITLSVKLTFFITIIHPLAKIHIKILMQIKDIKRRKP